MPSSPPPPPPVRNPSAITALPPPSRLLLPRVRSLECPRRTRHRNSVPDVLTNYTALEWLGLPLAFDVVQDQLEIDGYQMYAVEKWIVERNRPITVLTVYTGDPSHKITVTALAPSASLSEKDAAAHWEQALLHIRRDASARPKQTPAGVLMATSLAYFRSDYTIVHIPHGNFLLARDQLYANINLLRMGCGGRSALTLEEPSDSTKDRFISTYYIPEITLPCTLPLPSHYPTSSDHIPLFSSLPISPSSSITSKDAHLTSPSQRPSHHRNHSQTSPKGSTSKMGGTRPSIHIVEPSPTPSMVQGVTGGSLGPTTLALLSVHTKGKSKDLPFFNATVLELVKLVQVGLSLFGMYDVKEGLYCAGGPLLVDGLLCDVTVRGIERWIAEIGEPRAGLEPAERIAGPMFVSALLSLVLSIRNKLSSLYHSHAVPKDPFLHPHTFSIALSSYVSSSIIPQTISPSSPPIIPAYIGNGSHHLPLSPLYTTITTAPFSAATFLNPNPPFLTAHSHSSNASQHHIASAPTVLTRELVEVIETYYTKRVATINEGENTSTLASGLGSGIGGAGGGTGDAGVGASSSGLRDSNTISGGSSGPSGMPKSQTRGRVKRALKGKLDDLTSAVSSTVTESYDGGEGGDGGRDGSRIGGGGGGGGGTLSGTEADGNLSVGSSGGQIFRGMGNLLLSGASGITGAGSSPNSTACIWDVKADLERFVISVVNEQHSRKRGRRKKGSGRGSESVDFGRGGISVGGGSSSGIGGRSGAQFPGTSMIPQSVVNGEHGALVAMLWSGRVADIVALREWEKERERIENMEVSGLPTLAPVGSVNGVVSDGEEVRSEGLDGKSTEGEDSDLQMEGRPGGGSGGGGGGFGGVWSERMQRKLGSWTGLSKLRGQPPGSEFGGMGSIERSGKSGANRLSLGLRSPSSKVISGDVATKGGSKLVLPRAQSPTLHPGPLSGDLEQYNILYDNGPYSPSSEYKHNPFTLDDVNLPRGSKFYDISRGVSTAELGHSGSSNADTGPPPSKAQSLQQSTDALTNTGILPLQPAVELNTGKKVKTHTGLEATGKWEKSMRPVYQQQRVSSWSDARSAWNDEGFWMSGRSAKGKTRRPRLGRANTALDETREENVDVDVTDDADVGESEEERGGLREREVESDQDRWKRVKVLGVRRRSYHDLDSLRSTKVLSPERMKIDVELCAQVLIMVRREEHLRNVVACLETLTSSLQTTNSLLHNDFELHRDAINEIARRAQVISEIEAQVHQTDLNAQAKNTLQYESAQFLISELWHTASLSRKKVFELREKLFGAGGRRLPSGKHGAHGRYNRVQWTLDGERRLVDYLGRGEEEAEEENRVNVAGLAATRPPPPPEDEEEDVVELSGIKPIWLLRFFTSWGARWSALRVGGGHPQTAVAATNTSDSGIATDGTASSGTISGTTAEKG